MADSFSLKRSAADDERSAMLMAVAALALMLFAAVGASWLKPDKLLAQTRQDIDLESAIPRSFGDWKEDDATVMIVRSSEQEDTLNKIYDQIVSRTYVNSEGKRVMLSVAYGSAQTQQLRAHRQEVCYAAQGFKISGLEKASFPVMDRTVAGTRFTAAANERVEPVTYWFTMGDTVVRSHLDREWQQLRYALSGYVSDGYLYRVSSIGEEGDDAHRLHLKFSNDLLQSMDKQLAMRLVGDKT